MTVTNLKEITANPVPNCEVIEFPAHVLRGAAVCAAKNDVRYYLNGIHISTDGSVVGTDGHILFKGWYAHPDESNYRIAENTLLQFTDAIPLSAETVELTFQRDDSIVMIVCRNMKGKVIKRIAATKLEEDFKYPDYGRVIPDRSDTDRAGCIEIGVNIDFLAKAAKIFHSKYSGVKMQFGTADDSILITNEECLPNCLMVVMPMRLS